MPDNTPYRWFAGSVPPGADTYVIETRDALTVIKCLLCGMASPNPNDVARAYCGWCHYDHALMGSFRLGVAQVSGMYPIALDPDGCPDCHGREFRVGPAGGMNKNVECVACRSRFSMFWGGRRSASHRPQRNAFPRSPGQAMIELKRSERGKNPRIAQISQWQRIVDAVPHIAESDYMGGRGLRDGEASEWIFVEEANYFQIRGKNCEITLTRRADHCDRGRVFSQVFVDGGQHDLEVDYQDGWNPGRYYFFIDNAIEEIEAWLKERKQWVAKPSESAQAPSLAVS